MYYVYVLVNEKGKKYIGFTTDLKRRVREHNTKGNRYTSKYTKWKLVYYEAYLSKSDALKREKRLKDGRARHLLMERIENSLEEV